MIGTLWILSSDRKDMVADTKFLKKGSFGEWAGLSLWDRMRSLDIRRELREELLLISIKRSQPRWFGYLIRMPPRHLLLQVFWAPLSGQRPRGSPRTRWRDYICRLAGCYCDPTLANRKKMDGWRAMLPVTASIRVSLLKICTVICLPLVAGCSQFCSRMHFSHILVKKIVFTQFPEGRLVTIYG